jgi:polyhydroxybutyrate depolymerase
MRLKLVFTLCLILIIPEVSEAQERIHKGLTEKEVTVNGLARRFILYLPQSYSRSSSLPVIFLFHGGGGTPRSVLMINDGDDFRNISENDNVILVAPEGIKKSWNDGRETKADKLNVDDVGFVIFLIKYMEKNYQIDSTRIYATGISNGGFMTTRLGFEAGEKFAAIAVVAATAGEDIARKDTPRGFMLPVMYIHGTADPLVHFNGGKETIGAGGAYISHQAIIDKWVSIDNCQTTPLVTQLPDISNDATTVTRREYRNLSADVAVISYIINNGGHTWPGGRQYLPKKYIGNVCRDMNACTVIWDFFSKYKR